MMDARDLFRIIKTEEEHNVSCYTVSLDSSAHYSDRHLKSDCSTRTFLNQLSSKFPGIQFIEIIFDWFWFPIAWFKERLNIRFFSEIIIDFVKQDILIGSFFFPFNAFFIENIAAFQKSIQEYYTIDLIGEISEMNSRLWKSTMKIDHETIEMLGKEALQQNKYCSIDTESDLIKQLDGRRIVHEEVMEFLHNLTDNIADVRIIRLTRKFS